MSDLRYALRPWRKRVGATALVGLALGAGMPGAEAYRANPIFDVILNHLRPGSR